MGGILLDSWVDINQLDEINPIQEVCKRGFSMPSDGLVLPVGNIKLQDADSGMWTHGDGETC